MTISRQVLFGKLGATLYRSVESATSFCKLRGNPYVELLHWLHQLLQMTDSDLHRSSGTLASTVTRSTATWRARSPRYRRARVQSAIFRIMSNWPSSGPGFLRP